MNGTSFGEGNDRLIDGTGIEMQDAAAATDLIDLSWQERVMSAGTEWLTDPAQLCEWQHELVGSCREISRQLSRIQVDLAELPSPSAPVNLKVMTGVPAN